MDVTDSQDVSTKYDDLNDFNTIHNLTFTIIDMYGGKIIGWKELPNM